MRRAWSKIRINKLGVITSECNNALVKYFYSVILSLVTTVCTKRAEMHASTQCKCDGFYYPLKRSDSEKQKTHYSTNICGVFQSQTVCQSNPK